MRKLKKLTEDTELNIMYYLFNEKGITPSQYYAMSQGEKDIIKAMMLKNIEMRK